MKTEHKLAWALRAAADDENARFRSPQATCEYARFRSPQATCEYEIETVLARPNYEWQLVKSPVVTHAYYWRDRLTDVYRKLENNKNWDMHITLIDGVPQKEVEFR